MLQFYFLSIAANFIAGMTLSSDWLIQKFASLATILPGLSERRPKLAIGLGALLVGFGTLFVPAGSPLVLGDLFPSLMGMAMGIGLLFEVLKQDELFPAERVERTDKSRMSLTPAPPPTLPTPPGAEGVEGAEDTARIRAPVGYRTTLGVMGIVAAILHFFLPERPFL